MAQHQLAFEGRTAYQLLAKKGDGVVWDELERKGHLVSLTEAETALNGTY